MSGKCVLIKTIHIHKDFNRNTILTINYYYTNTPLCVIHIHMAENTYSPPYLTINMFFYVTICTHFQNTCWWFQCHLVGMLCSLYFELSYCTFSSISATYDLIY